MRLLVLVSLLAVATSAAPHGYNSAVRHLPQGCRDGRVLHIDGTCVYPIVHRFVYVYAAPEQPQVYGPPPHIPRPRVHHNLVFIKAPEPSKSPDPIILPPPTQENIVYILSKQPRQDGQQVIEVPASPPTTPQVYFINYDDHNTPILPGGIDFQDALNSAIGHPHQDVGGAGVAAGGVISNPGEAGVQSGAYGPPPNTIKTLPSLYPLP